MSDTSSDRRSFGPTAVEQLFAWFQRIIAVYCLMFGVLWARTRSLALVVLVHGFTDLIPNLAPFVKTWLLT